MTFIEALKESQKTGAAYVRTGHLHVGWIRWDPTHKYEFSGEDLLADDWAPLAGQTYGNGRYVATGVVL